MVLVDAQFAGFAYFKRVHEIIVQRLQVYALMGLRPLASFGKSSRDAFKGTRKSHRNGWKAPPWSHKKKEAL